MDQPISDYQPPIEPSITPPDQLLQIAPKNSPILPILISMVILILMSAVGYLGFQVYRPNSTIVVHTTPSPSPKTYLTYTSDTFTFQYPSEIEKLIEKKSWGVTVGCECELFNWFDVEYIPTTLSPTEWWDTEGKNRFNGKDDDNKLRPKLEKTILTNLTIKNLGGLEIIAQTPKNPTPQKAYERGGEQMMKIYLIPGTNGLVMVTANDLGGETELPQILSTFRFTNTEKKQNSEISWVKKQITKKNGLEFRGGADDVIEFLIPSTWTLSNTSITSPDPALKCFNYQITDPSKKITLMFNPVCDSWQAEYLNFPADGIVINSQKGVGNDGHDEYIIRYENNGEIKYGSFSMERDQPLDKSKKSLEDILIPESKKRDGAFFMQVSAKLNGDNTEKKQYLEITDQIIKSIQYVE